jgi:hypothetical protein
MTDLEERIARLPGWARDHIKRLEDAPENLRGEMARRSEKIAYLEGQLKRLRDRCEAMEAIFTAAARGGNETAQAFVERTLKEWAPEPEDK